MDDALQHYSKIDEGAANVICPPNVVGMMTGTQWVKQHRDGSISLIYEDGTAETVGSDIDIVTGFEDYFAIVAYVQDQRTRAVIAKVEKGE